jgi:hypothetical protein
MTDKTDETGKGSYRPGDPPRRPSATIDVEATELGRERDHQPGATGGSLPARLWVVTLGALASAWVLGRRLARDSAFPSHVAAGVAGAALTLATAGLVGLFGGGQGSERASSDVAKRLAVVEKALSQRPAVPGDVAAKLAGAEARLTKMEERAEAAQARLAAEARATEARLLPPELAPNLAERLAKLEAALASSASAEDKSGDARLAADKDIAQLKGEAQSLRQSLDALKGTVEEQLRQAAKAGDIAPVMTRLATFERELKGVVKTEGERAAGAQQVLLALEVSALKRALDRGDSYQRELDAVRKAAGGSIDLAPLERDSRTGVTTLSALMQDFRRSANAAIDADRARPDASVLDRLVAGARSVIRWRKASYDADDASIDAVLARMEGALGDGHLGEALAQGRRLPPRAAAAMDGWLRRVEARTAADRAVADVEAALKASLAGGRASAPEGTR